MITKTFQLQQHSNCTNIPITTSFQLHQHSNETVPTHKIFNQLKNMNKIDKVSY